MRNPGSTMLNGIALSPATNEKLAWVTTTTEVISGTLEGDAGVFAVMTRDAMLTFQLP